MIRKKQKFYIVNVKITSKNKGIVLIIKATCFNEKPLLFVFFQALEKLSEIVTMTGVQ